MSKRLEEMLRIARAATKGPWELSARLGPHDGSEGFYRISAANTLSLEVRPCADGYVPGQNAANAQHIATFNPRTAEALVKVALAAIEPLHGEDYGYHRCKICGGDSVAQITGIYHKDGCPIRALTAAMEDNSNEDA